MKVSPSSSSPNSSPPRNTPRSRWGTRRALGVCVVEDEVRVRRRIGVEGAAGGAGRPHRGEVPRTGTLGAKFQARRTTLPRTLRLFGRRTRRSTRAKGVTRARPSDSDDEASPPRARADCARVPRRFRNAADTAACNDRGGAESPARRLPRDARPMSAARKPIRDVPTRVPRTRSASRKQSGDPRKTRRDQLRNFGERIRSGHRVRRRPPRPPPPPTPPRPPNRSDPSPSLAPAMFARCSARRLCLCTRNRTAKNATPGTSNAGASDAYTIAHANTVALNACIPGRSKGGRYDEPGGAGTPRRREGPGGGAGG